MTDPQGLSGPEALKRKAAEAAAAEVETGMALGLGTGSTVAHLLDVLGERVREGLKIVGVPTSVRTEDAARALGIPLTTLEDTPELDLCIDGADEVAPNLDCTKGLGGALVREKVVADASARFVVMVDGSKMVKRLGERSPIPVEVLPFAASHVARRLCDLDARLRVDGRGAFTSDNGNCVLDLHTGPIGDPAALARRLEATPGVVDHGLFLGMATAVLVADPTGVRKVQK